MYIITGVAAIIYGILSAMKFSKTEYQKNETKPAMYDLTMKFIQKFFIALFVLWSIETYIYYKILTMDPTP